MNLRLLQIGDSALPIGGYSHSWGLEAAIDRGLVRDPSGLEQWVRSWLRYAAGPLEGVLVAVVCRAAAQQDWTGVLTANQVAAVSLAPPTLRQASGQMGEHLLALAEAWPWAAEAVATLRQAALASPEPPWQHAVVFAFLAAAAGSEPAEAVLVYLHQATLGVIGAGVRAIPIGHTHGQEILARLHEDVQALANELVDRELETAGSFCPAYEILCHAQTQLYTRIFRS